MKMATLPAETAEPVVVIPAQRAWVTVARCAAIAAFVVAVTLFFFFFLKSRHGLTWVLLDATWDDGRTFYRIATEGYRNLPLTEYRELGLYPLFLRLVHPIAGIYSLLVVSLGFSALNSVLFYLILRRWYASERVSFAAALVLSVARQPVFFMQFIKWQLPSMTICNSIQGSEGVYLFGLLAAFYLYKSERVPQAFLLVGLSSVTRMTGIIAAAGLWVDLVRRRQWRRSLWAAIPCAILASHFAYYAYLTGDFFVVFKAHHAFNHLEHAFTYPFADLFAALRGQYRELGEGSWGWVVIYGYCIGGLGILAIKREWALLLVTAPIFLLFLCLRDWSLHGRYYETLFGVPFAYAMLFARRGRVNIGASPVLKDAPVSRAGAPS
ncbi:MAG: hypothetical protein HY901_16480 [Deltaproteobacteria bacterium]|nr:hypothetical protein [Deltaproteobacteria bacterium]